MSPNTNASRSRTVRRAVLSALLAVPALVVATRGVARAQAARDSHESTMAADGSALHMEMTPTRAPVPGDSARAATVAAELRAAIGKYRDTATAVADGYRMFAPQIKNQKVYHFTRGWSAVQEAFRFDASKPTSLLYVKGADGKFVLVGGMYTAPNVSTTTSVTVTATSAADSTKNASASISVSPASTTPSSVTSVASSS